MNDSSRLFKCLFLKNQSRGTSSGTQWLRPCASKCRDAGDAGSIPGQRIKIPNAVLYSTANKLKKKKMKVGILFNTTLSSIDYLFCITNVEYLSQIKYTHSLNTFITINYNIIISPSKDLEIP